MRLYKITVDKDFNVLNYSLEEGQIDISYSYSLIALGFVYCGVIMGRRSGDYYVDMDAIKTRKYWSDAYDNLYRSLNILLRDEKIKEIT